MKSLLNNLKSCFSRCLKALVRFFKSIDSSAVIAVPVVIAYILILPKTASLVTMGYIERYFFPGMTVFLIFIVSVIVKALISLKPNNKKSIVFTLLMTLIIVYLDLRSNVFTNEFKFEKSGDKELTEALNGREVYIVVDNIARDMTWISSVVKDADKVYIDLTGEIESGEHDIPELPEDCLVLLNSRGFLAEDESGNPITEYDITTYVSKPHIIQTTRQFTDELGEKNNCTYTMLGEYDSFIGVLRLYECNE